MFSKKKRYEWIDATGVRYAYIDYAETVKKGMAKRYPERKWRVYGHSLLGWIIQVRVEVQ